MTQNVKANGTPIDRKNELSLATEEFRERMAKLRGEFEEALQSSREGRAEAEAALKLRSR